MCHVPYHHVTPELTTCLPVRTSCPDTSGTHPAGCQDPFGRTYALIVLQNTIPLRSVISSSLVLLRTTSHVLSVPIPVHMPLRYSTLWFPFSIFPDLFQMKHIVSIYTQVFPPVSPVWISTSVPPVSFSVWSLFRNRTLCARGRNAQVETKSFCFPSTLKLFWSASALFPRSFRNPHPSRTRSVTVCLKANEDICKGKKRR